MNGKQYLVFLVLMLTACAGTGSGMSYVYTPLHTPGGVMCTDQCHKSFEFCRQACALDYHACVSDIQAVAMRDYDRYAREKFDARQPLDKNVSDFEDTESCVLDHERCLAECDTPYNTCYSTCGGEVTPAFSCFLFCAE